MKKFLIIMACVFAVLTIILYFTSLNHLDSKSAKALGVSTTINIQGTVFCAACAIICALNIVGAIILNYLEENTTSYPSSAGGLSHTGFKTEDGGVQLNSGHYWTCPKCKTRNPYSKIECKECGTLRS